MNEGWKYLVFGISFFFGAGIPHENIGEIAQYLLNKSAYRKLTKGQSFFDWLLARRLRDIVPRRYLIFYALSCYVGMAILIFMAIFDIFLSPLQLVDDILIFSYLGFFVVLPDVVERIRYMLFWGFWKGMFEGRRHPLAEKARWGHLKRYRRNALKPSQSKQLPKNRR